MFCLFSKRFLESLKFPLNEELILVEFPNDDEILLLIEILFNPDIGEICELINELLFFSFFFELSFSEINVLFSESLLSLISVNLVLLSFLK